MLQFSTIGPNAFSQTFQSLQRMHNLESIGTTSSRTLLHLPNCESFCLYLCYNFFRGDILFLYESTLCYSSQSKIMIRWRGFMLAQLAINSIYSLYKISRYK